MTRATHVILSLSPHLRRAAWLALVLAACLIDTATAQEFTALLVSAGTGHDMATGAPGRIHVSGDKVRLETPEVPSGFFVTDAAANTAYFVRPSLRTFMEARQSSVLAQLFVPLDPDDPCARWQAMAKLSGAAADGAWQCTHSGEATLDGRAVATWRAVSPRSRGFVVTIDRALRVPLRLETTFGTSFSLVEIVPGPQPDTLFKVPPSYQKFDPQGLIDRIKQSDVWVEPPP
jgi:hypothetical protein